MKLTKEDIQNFATEDEKKTLKEISSINKGEIYTYLQSITDEIIKLMRDADNADADPWQEIFQILVEIYEKGEGK